MYPFDQDNQQQYEHYAQAADSGDYSQINPTQAAGHVQQFMQNAPSAMQQQVYQQHFAQMPQEQRQQFAQHLPLQYQQQMDPSNPQQMAQGFQQLGQQHPDLLQSLMGAGGMMGGGSGMAGLAGLVAKHLLGGQGGSLL